MKVNLKKKVFICGKCGKRCSFDEIFVHGGYHPRAKRHIFFTWCNHCEGQEPITPEQAIEVHAFIKDGFKQTYCRQAR